jgi:hypothetical protein
MVLTTVLTSSSYRRALRRRVSFGLRDQPRPGRVASGLGRLLLAMTGTVLAMMLWACPSTTPHRPRTAP